MGAVCGKSSADDAGDAGEQPAQAGRIAAPPQPQTTSLVPRKIGGPGRAVGGKGEASSDPAELRRKAAEAAEKRANANKPKGKIGQQLENQRKMSRNEALGAASRDELLARNADANTEALAHN